MHGRCRAPWRLIVLIVALDDPEPTELQRPDLLGRTPSAAGGRGGPSCVAPPAPCREEHGARQLGIRAGSSAGAGSTASSGSRSCARAYRGYPLLLVTLPEGQKVVALLVTRPVLTTRSEVARRLHMPREAPTATLAILGVASSILTACYQSHELTPSGVGRDAAAVAPDAGTGCFPGTESILHVGEGSGCTHIEVRGSDAVWCDVVGTEWYQPLRIVRADLSAPPPEIWASARRAEDATCPHPRVPLGNCRSTGLIWDPLVSPTSCECLARVGSYTRGIGFGMAPHPLFPWERVDAREIYLMLWDHDAVWDVWACTGGAEPPGG